MVMNQHNMLNPGGGSQRMTTDRAVAAFMERRQDPLIAPPLSGVHYPSNVISEELLIPLTDAISNPSRTALMSEVAHTTIMNNKATPPYLKKIVQAMLAAPDAMNGSV